MTGLSSGTRGSAGASVDPPEPGRSRRSDHPVSGGPMQRLLRGYALLTYLLRWPILLIWLIVAGWLFTNPPDFSGGDESQSLMPLSGAAAQAEIRDVEHFGYPLSSRTAVVQHDPNGLSLAVQAESILDAISINQHPVGAPILGALPLANTVRWMDGQAEVGTTVITYLFMSPDADFGDQHTAARQYYYRFLDRPEDHVVGVAGSVPARAQQGWLLSQSIPQVEALTLGAIFILVGLAFRSIVVPLLALGASGIAVFATTWLLSTISQVLNVGAPTELRPLLVALILGIVTDYTVFYVVGFGAELRKNRGSVKEAIVASVGSYTPIIFAAGITVAAATAVLLVAEEQFFHAFGPAMAVTILVGLLISITLVPALMSVLGPKVFWPRRDPRLLDPDDERSAVETGSSRVTTWLANTMVRKPAAVLAVVVCTLLLVAASLPLFNIKLGADFAGALPADNSVSEANAAAVAGFAPGITSPTTLLIEGDGITSHEQQLIELQRLVSDEPGVAGVIGPRQQFPRIPNLMLAGDGDAARMMIVLDHTPLGAEAIANLADLRERLPGLGAQAGLPSYSYSFTGDTALAEGLVSGTVDDLKRIAIVGFLVNFALLAIFLRALLAPLFLLLSSVLALTASLGVTTWVFMDLLGHEGLTFYVPFAAAVLLVALGSDYNIFGVGRVWELAREMTLREAIRQAMPETSKAITTAGLALAVSFGMLAVIPVTSFHELAVAMSVGILIDSFLVRSVMMPAMLTLMGLHAAWPNKRLLPFDRSRRRDEIDADRYSKQQLRALWRPRSR